MTPHAYEMHPGLIGIISAESDLRLEPSVRISSVRSSTALLPVGTEASDHLIKGMAGVSLSLSMSQADPIETQMGVCEAIAQLTRDRLPEVSQLDTLFALDEQAQPLSKLLLTRYVEGDSGRPPFQWAAWHSAMRLSQSLFRGYEYFLHHIRKTTDDHWAGHEPSVLVQLFHHRKVDFLLRFLRYKKRNLEQWRELHEMYRLARERNLLNRSDAMTGTVGASRTVTALEQEYLQILLLEAMNNGQFSPREAVWANRWFARWCSGPGLRFAKVKNICFEPKGFVVDLGGSDGLKRPPGVGGDLLYFDSSPLSGMIDQEIASLRDGAAHPDGAALAVRAGQLALLAKLAILFAPNAVRIERRAERRPVALTAQAIAGFPYIVEEVRKSGQNDGTSPASSAGTENTISPFVGPDCGDAGPASFSPAGPFNAIPETWQVKDRSDSGCRMRGQVDNLNRVIPGSLIAIRDSETAAWTVSVVRWFRRLMADYVEIGVEYLGRNPRFVKMVAGYDRDLATAEVPDSMSRCFAALYLPASGESPTMPIKTLLLPAGKFRTDCDVTLLSSNATYRMRLNEPIQQQFEYVWTSFAVIDKVTRQPTSIE